MAMGAAEGSVEVRDGVARFRWVWWLLGLSEKTLRGGFGLARFVREDDEGAACLVETDDVGEAASSGTVVRLNPGENEANSSFKHEFVLPMVAEEACL
ncbi:unnamed protein product [Dovyalis caffra]|uniref:Uncharacterized protein n=1 Tax=Dovyalis caffra TaxID=77055 RepID=A0AAV1RHN4_9ROSI|nr:unnamed protein product [Dovyalis caffra]